ncbi:uncharacterized protein LOC141532996 isoform X2 [Cotesia typhae]
MMTPRRTMEEEIWLMEEMLRRPPQLLLTPTKTTTTSTITPTTPKKTNIRVIENRPVRTRIHWLRRPFIRTKPGLSRPFKRPLIHPASAEMIVGMRKATRPGPPVTSGPRRTTKAQGNQQTNNRGPSDTEASHTLTNEPAFPTEAAASFIKRKRRIGRWRGASIISNPGPLAKSGPQPEVQPKKISTDSPQLMDVPANNDAAWLTYDDAPLLEAYPTEFQPQTGELFTAPTKVLTPLEKVLATLTRLEEVQDEQVTKRRQFTAYDQDLRLYRVTRTAKTPTPWVKPLGKTVHQLLEEKERDEKWQT